MNPDCIVCGAWLHSEDRHHASWGPITVYYHDACKEGYEQRVAPRLRDALTLAIRRWHRHIQGLQKGTTSESRHS